MKYAIGLYWHLVWGSLKSQMQYKVSFLILTAARFFTIGLEFASLWILFDRFGPLKDWTLPEVALLYGMANMAFAIAEGTARGFDTFATLVRLGHFDRMLLRPCSTALQVAGQELQLDRLGRLLQGLAILLWAITTTKVPWHLADIALLFMAIGGGACIFMGLFILQATFSFWSTESLEIFNTVTYGGVEIAQYPLDIFRKEFRQFFTYIIPFGVVLYFPALTILGKPAPLIMSFAPYLAPLLGVIFLFAALQIWQFGERHYRSTGS